MSTTLQSPLEMVALLGLSTLSTQRLWNFLEDSQDHESTLIKVCLSNIEELSVFLSPLVLEKSLMDIQRDLEEHLGPQCWVALVGKGEFLVWLSEKMDQSLFEDKMRIFLDSFRERNPQNWAFSFNAGGCYVDEVEDASEFFSYMAKTDLAVKKSKLQGPGRFFLLKQEVLQRLKKEWEMDNDVRRAFEEKQFFLVYQPLVEVESRQLCGVEALLRWNHPTKGAIPPDIFIPVLERLGYMVEVGKWTIHQACFDVANLHPDIRVAINLSAAQFQDPDLLLCVKEALQNTTLAPSRLEIEITETTLMYHTEQSTQTLHQLREMGVRIAMDDFGTGYSSLSYLQTFKFDKIKMDRTFVQGMAASKGSVAIVQAVAQLADKLGMQVLAEGVETQEQLEQLRKDGFNEAQGYLFSKPLPLKQVEDILQACLNRVWIL